MVRRAKVPVVGKPARAAEIRVPSVRPTAWWGHGWHSRQARRRPALPPRSHGVRPCRAPTAGRSEEHTSELQSLMRISYAVFCLKKKKKKQNSEEENKTTR